jgi:hypothetical protein
MSFQFVVCDVAGAFVPPEVFVTSSADDTVLTDVCESFIHPSASTTVVGIIAVNQLLN